MDIFLDDFAYEDEVVVETAESEKVKEKQNGFWSDLKQIGW